ncbi:MAG: hypothetical protein KF880_09405 [Ferruginibacter sp.]|nr:hypothetical protein [Ferruginibacter sp.]
MKLNIFRKNYLVELLIDQKRIRNGQIYQYKKHDQISAREISRKLNEIGIKTFKSTGNYIYIDIPYEDLYDIFKKKQWLDDDDEKSSDTEYDIDDLDDNIMHSDDENIIITQKELQQLLSEEIVEI